MKDVLELELIKKEIAGHCAFSLGKEMIMELEPRFDLLHVKRELARCDEAIQCVISYGSMPFGAIHDVRYAVKKAMKDMNCTPQELLDIASLHRGCRQIQGYMNSVQCKKEELLELSDSLMIDYELCRKIESCISPSGEVMDSASSELRSIRQRIRSAEAEVASAVQKFIASNGSKLTDTITTMRDDRICVLVKSSEKNTIRGFIHGESASGATAYVEPENVILANNKLQAAKSAEQEEIKRILFELSQAVKQSGDATIADCETIGMLDGYFARAEYAKEIHGCVAAIEENGTHLYLKKARHPLIDPNKVVANTYELKDKKMLLITGSNTGGKTVTLKTIGLFVLMSGCGFPIACEEAILPAFDAVYVDIGDEQSIEQSLSTFSAHLTKLAMICEKATEKSLIILDELGSGTDPKEGEALAIAVLDEFRQKKSMVLASTHYSRLKLIGARWPEVLCSSVEFDLKKMAPTYRYIEGLSGQSNAFEIARRFGLKESIIQHAMQLKEENESDQDKLAARLDSLVEENLALKAKLEKDSLELEELKKQLLSEKNEFDLKKEREMEEAHLQAAEIVENAKEESQRIIDELKSTQSAKIHELLDIKKQLNEIEPTEEKNMDSDETFHVGDYVLIKKYNYYGDVEEVKNKYLIVQANGIRMKLKPSECAHAQKQKPKKKTYVSNISKNVSPSISMECNVIGERASDALVIVDKYLDTAILKGLSQVRLIHGVGTGALRSAIWDYLKKNKHVASYRIGGEGEGGTGATVVTLKTKGK